MHSAFAEYDREVRAWFERQGWPVTEPDAGANEDDAEIPAEQRPRHRTPPVLRAYDTARSTASWNGGSDIAVEYATPEARR